MKYTAKKIINCFILSEPYIWANWYWNYKQKVKKVKINEYIIKIRECSNTKEATKIKKIVDKINNRGIFLPNIIQKVWKYIISEWLETAKEINKNAWDKILFMIGEKLGLLSKLKLHNKKWYEKELEDNFILALNKISLKYKIDVNKIKNLFLNLKPHYSNICYEYRAIDFHNFMTYKWDVILVDEESIWIWYNANILRFQYEWCKKPEIIMEGFKKWWWDINYLRKNNIFLHLYFLVHTLASRMDRTSLEKFLLKPEELYNMINKLIVTNVK